MITKCPQCQQEIRFNKAQSKKVATALEQLSPGSQLTIKCPHCQAAVKLDAAVRKSNRDNELSPPEPPDLEWLKTGRFDGGEKVWLRR